MSGPGALAAILFLLLGGEGVRRVFRIRGASVSLPGRLGTSFALGLIWMTLGLFVASQVGIRPSVASGFAFVATPWLVALALGRGLRVASPPNRVTEVHEFRGSTATTVCEWALGIGIAATWLAVALVSIYEPLADWDVLAIWAYKGKLLLAEPISETRYFQDPSRAYSHLDYPLLWPLAMSWMWTLGRAGDLFDPKLLAPAVFAAYLAVFHGFLSRRHDRLAALLFTALLAGLPFLGTQTARLLADVPLSLFFAGAALSALAWLEEGEDSDLRLSGLMCVGLLFTKNEGMALYAILLGVFALALLCHRGRKPIGQAVVWLIAVPLLSTASWFVLRIGIPQLHEDYASRLRLDILAENASRIPVVLEGLLRCTLEVEDWLLFWPALVLYLLVTSRHWMRRELVWLFALAELPILVYVLVLVISPWSPDSLLNGTLSRLLLHSLPLQVFLIAEVARRAGHLPRAAERPVETA